MKDNIFADLYNKVVSFFVTGDEPQEKTKVAAMSRLKSVLMQDRAGFSERSIQMLKDDMLECISKYMDIEEESFDLQISPEEDKTVLMLSIPVLRAKTDEEIDEAIKKDEEKAQTKAKEIVEQLKDIVEEKVQELTSDEEENSDEEALEEENLKEENEESSDKVEEKQEEEVSDDEKIEEIKSEEISENSEDKEMWIEGSGFGYPASEEDYKKSVKNKKK